MPQRLAFEILHRYEVPAFMLIDIGDCADVRMIKGGSRLGLALESLQGMAVSGQLLGQELQGDETVELRVLGLVDDTHATAAMLLNNLVVRNRLADFGHGGLRWVILLA